MPKNKAGYTAQDAPSTRLKITGDGRTDGRTDTTSYRDATAHLKNAQKNLLRPPPFTSHNSTSKKKIRHESYASIIHFYFSNFKASFLDQKPNFQG